MNAENNVNKISFNYKYGKVRIYKSVIQALGNPRYIRFLIQPGEKRLYVCGLNEREPDCFPVAEYKDSRHQGVVLHGQRFIRKISEIAGWELVGIRVVCGKFISDANMFEFDLAAALQAVGDGTQ